MNPYQVAFSGCGHFLSAADTNLHAHPQPELVLLLRGHCTITVGGKSLPAKAGGLYVLPGNVPHIQYNHEETENYYAIGSLPETLLPTTARTLDFAQDGLISAWFGQLHQLHQAVGLNTHEVAAGLFYTLVQYISLKERKDAKVGLLHPGLQETVKLMQRKVRTGLSVQQMAACANLSTSHFKALFKKEMGEPPLRYFQRLKMDYAKRLLRDPYLTVQQVAFECGFEDSNYFSRQFSNITGMTPTQFRSGLEASSAADVE